MRRELGMFVALVVMCLALFISNSDFLGQSNAINTLRQISMLGIYAIGSGFVIVTGGIDLSVGSLMGLSAVIFGKLWRDGITLKLFGILWVSTGPLPIGVAALLTLPFGAVAGSHRLVRVGLGSRAGSSRFDSWDVCLGRANCFFVGFAGFVQLVAYL